MRTSFPRMRPARLLVVSFGAAILIGTVLLSLPLSTRGTPLGLVDALFTATSSVCVTGLVVVDTGTRFTPFGQAVMLLLIQLGGLGIMTLGTFFVAALGGRLGWRGRDLLTHTITPEVRGDFRRLLSGILLLTFTFEAAGAVLLFVRFAGRMAPVPAAWHALFHSISAFCNAGFSLNADSFEGYVTDPLVNLTLMGLIVAGGLGFVVLIEVRGWIRDRLAGRRRHPGMLRRTSLHTRITLTFSAAIVLTAFLLILFLEWHDTLTGLTLPQKVMASLFQSVTPRTAGFNTLPIGSASNATLFLIILVMFVGGGSGSCAGGVKVSTFGVLFSLALSRVRGGDDTLLFDRRVSEKSVAEALSVVAVGVTTVVVFTFLLVSVEVGTVSFGETRGEFIRLFFEVVSAFGTVGLTTGETVLLSPVGRLLVTALMFIGRLGPLTVAIAVMQRRAEPPYRHIEEDVMVG